MEVAKKCDFYLMPKMMDSSEYIMEKMMAKMKMSVPMLKVSGSMSDIPLDMMHITSKMYGNKIGVVNSNSKYPVQFIFKHLSYPVTNFGSPRFVPTVFKPFPMSMSMHSGIGHQTLHGNQMMFAKFRCVRLFVTHFQVLDMNGNVVKNEVRMPPTDKDCVVFRVK